MIDRLQVTSILIDDPNVNITKSFDGDMVFSDNFIPRIKLKELVNGGTLIIDKGLVVIVNTSDYTYLPSEELYAIDIPHNFNFVGNAKCGIIVETWDWSFTKFTPGDVTSYANSTYLKVTQPLNMFVMLKRTL